MLEGIIRESMTKGATKTLRKDGYLIANIYGKGLENINAAFNLNDFIRAVKKKDGIAFPVNVAGKELNVVVQSYQKDPITNILKHVDLMVAQPGVRAAYNVPVVPVGTPKGLKNKGLLHFHQRRVPVKCTIENLPNSFEIQVADLDTGDNVLVRDIEFPEGVNCRLEGRVPVIGVIKAK